MYFALVAHAARLSATSPKFMTRRPAFETVGLACAIDAISV